uniref:THD domain-containing protein n=1 Tax=Xiphophorus couchianus TaxID=32473 RepID=A0A3B5KLY5_9TELE
MRKGADQEMEALSGIIVQSEQEVCHSGLDAKLTDANGPSADSVNVANLLSGSQLEWRARFGGGAYSRGLWAIVVPETGLYFVYMKFVLKGPARDFRVTLQRRSKGYDRDMDLMGAQDGGPYPTGPPDGGGGHHRVRTVYVGQLFDLWRGDQLKVLISEGQELIDRASFGAFRT